MEVGSHSRSLFGLSFVLWIQYWRAGWSELFWGPSSDIRRRLEAPVELLVGDEESPYYYIAERPLQHKPASADTLFQACLLPAEFVLLRTLELPQSLEADLDAAVTYEVQACSPFLPEDTCYGWSLRARRQNKLQVVLAIAAACGVVEYLQQQGHNTGARVLPEVWCFTTSGEPIVLKGFGEKNRFADYRWRLCLATVISAFLVAIILALLAVPGLVRHIQIDKMEYHFAKAQHAATEALHLREQLAIDNERALELQQVIERQINQRHFLHQLADQTSDDVFFQHLQIEGDLVQLRGLATSAASLMQILADDSRYTDVKAPSGIRRDVRSGLEQFTLELRIVTGIPAE